MQQVILNYKSYFEAFKLGVVDDGFTAVARVLFLPIFKDKLVVDEKGVPFEVDNTNASRWGNGQAPIPVEIQRFVSDDLDIQDLINYFEKRLSLTSCRMYFAMKCMMQCRSSSKNATCVRTKRSNC